MAGMMIARNLDLLKTGIAAAADGWKPLVARGYALGSEEMTTPFTKATGSTRPVLTGTVSGASFAVHIRSDAVYYARTEVTTTAPKPCDAVMGVQFNPGGIMGYLREWIGQDIQIGDELFDPAYLITGKPESAPVGFQHLVQPQTWLNAQFPWMLTVTGF